MTDSSGADLFPGGGPVDLATLARAEFVLWLDGYGWGIEHGVELGRAGIEREFRGTWPVSAAVARFVAAAGTYADLADRRGEPGRADAQRAILRERGIL